MEWGKIYDEWVTGTGSMIFEEFEKYWKIESPDLNGCNVMVHPGWRGSG